MTNYFLTILLILILLPISLKSNDLEIFNFRINKANGVPKVELLNHLSDSLLQYNPAQSKQFANQAFKVSTQIGKEQLKAISLYNVAYSCYYLGEFSDGISSLNEALKISKDLNNTEFQIDILTLQGIMLKSSNNFFEANKSYENALELCLKIKENNKTAMILNNLGNVFEAQGDYESAVKNYLRALKYYNTSKDSLELALGYINLGKMFSNLENFNQAREFFQTALNYCNNSMLNEKAVINNCLGTIYYAQNNLESALLLFNKALSISDNLQDKRNLAYILNNIAEVHRSRENYDEAIKYYAFSQEINNKYHYNLGSANVEINLAHLYMMQKDMPKAKAKLELAESIINKFNFKSLKLELFEKYAKYYDIKGDLKTALKYKDEYIKLKDTISYIDRNRKLNSLIAKFTMEGKDKQIEEYEADKRITELEITQKKIFIAFLVITILFFIVLLWFFFSKNKVIAKHEKELETINQDLEKANAREKEITEMNKMIVDIVVHNFKVPLSTIKSNAELILVSSENGKIDRIGKQVGRITKTVNDQHRFLNQLLDLSKNEGVKLNDDITSIDICDYLKTLLNNEFMDSIDHRHNFILNFPEKPVIIQISLVILDHIFHNLISNAVKYSKQDTDINIDLSVKSDLLYCSIKDDGIGIPLAEQDKLFRKYHRFSNTDGIKGTGIGLHLVKRVITELNGNIEVISAENKGTLVNISFPLDTRT